MKNVTVCVDEETYRRARVRAAGEGASLSAKVRGFLQSYAAERTEFERLKQDELRLRTEIEAGGYGIPRSEWLTREELYDRAARRTDEEGFNPTHPQKE